ncbi:C-type lectin domain family 1 member A [Tamandua tetradactyla]|uniref:C-type lectin domain family 1 member A n=1 Tax=Tamandua tetradactyla TaxID=48850 RepID=UPI0040542C41
MAEKLCRELYNKTGDAAFCPEKWKWHGNKCYQFYKESKSWQGCEYFCIAENSTMLKINTLEVLIWDCGRLHQPKDQGLCDHPQWEAFLKGLQRAKAVYVKR